MNNRTALRAAIHQCAAIAKATGTEIDVREFGDKIENDFPDSGMTAEGIRREIELAAVAIGVRVMTPA